jgi:capsular polysaccharide biosynthesis protein
MQDDSTATMYELWGDLLKRKWLLVGVFVAFSGLGVAVAFLSEPIYRAEIVMIAADSKNQEGLLGSLASNLGGFAAFLPPGTAEGSAKNESLAVLLSRFFTRDFIESQEILPILFADRWDEGSGKWRDPDNIPTMNDAVRRFDNEIRGIEDDRITGVMTLSIEWNDPGLAADWANLIVEQVNARTRATAIEEAELSLIYLNEELRKTNVVDLQQAIYGLIQTKINEIMLANVRKEYAFKVLDPAVASDLDDFVSPQRLLLISAAMMAGLLIGGFLTLFLGAVDRARATGARSTMNPPSHSEPHAAP